MSFLRNLFYKVYCWNQNENFEDNKVTGKKDTFTVNPFTLSFNPKLEDRFLHDYHKRFIPFIKISGIMGKLLFISFFYFDIIFVPEYFTKFLFIRIMLGVLLGTIILLSTGKSNDFKKIQPILSISSILVGIANISFMIIAAPKLNDIYYIGIILNLIWIFVVLRLRSIWAAFAGISILVIFLITAPTILNFDSKLYLISSTYLIISNFFGLIIAYLLEYSYRKLYYQKGKLEESQIANERLNRKIDENERGIRKFIENSSLGIYKVTKEGEIILYNNTLIKILGFNNIEEIKAKGLINCLYQGKKDKEKLDKSIKESGELIGHESLWIKNDGNVIYLRINTQIIYENSRTCYEGTIENITSSMINQIKLKASNERLKTLFNNVYDAVFIHDIDGKVLDINNKVIDLYNTSQEQIKNLNIKDISSATNDFKKLEAAWQDVIEKGKTFKFEWRSKHHNDEYEFDTEIFLSRIKFGSDYYILASVRDITDLKESHRKLLLTQETVEFNTTPIYWFNNKYKIIYANNSAIKQIGYSLNELYKMKFEDFIRNELKEKWIQWCEDNIQGNSSTKFEIDITRKNGHEFPAEVNVTNIFYENEEIAIVLVTDITKRKKIAQNLILAKEKAEQSDKLKTEFLAGMSHEIRTPINTILNFISLIKNELGKNITEDTSFAFQMIDSGSKRLIRTIDSILNMSQFQTGSYDVFLEEISLVENILSPLINEFKQTAKAENLEFYFENNVDNPIVFADEYTLKQLFINLIDNGIKYTKEGYVKIRLDADDKFCFIDIEDSGIGMAEEFIPTLFQPFSQEEQGYTRTFEGNGLGLALVKKYIDINNGTISVESKKGEGTAFKIKLHRLR